MPEPITVVTVTYNSARQIPDFASSLSAAAQVQPLQLVVSDNASTDDTVALVERHAPDAVILRSAQNRGYAAGINAAIRKITPQGPVLVVNPDVRLHRKTVPVLAAMLQDPAVGIAVPQLRDENGHLHFSLRRDPRVLRVLGEAVLGGHLAGRHDRLGEMITDERRYAMPQNVDWATGACMLISAECWRRVGSWNEDFFLYSEETDFALRTRDAGLTIRYHPVAQATHLGGDAHISPELFELLTLNRWRFYRARHGRTAGLAFRAALTLDAVPRAAAGRSTARAALRGLLSPGSNPDHAARAR